MHGSGTKTNVNHPLDPIPTSTSIPVANIETIVQTNFKTIQMPSQPPQNHETRFGAPQPTDPDQIEVNFNLKTNDQPVVGHPIWKSSCGEHGVLATRR